VLTENALLPSQRALLKYSLALADPRSSAPCGYPGTPSVPSFKAKFVSNGTFSTGSTDGYGYAVFSPTYASNSIAGKYSPGGALAFLDWANASNAYVPTNFTSAQMVASYVKGRVVAAALYIRNVTPLLNRGGQLTLFRQPDGQNVTAATSGYNSYGEINNLKVTGHAFAPDASSGKWSMIEYVKSDPSDYDFHGANYPQNTGYCVGAIAVAPNATPQTYEYEWVQICEFIGGQDSANAQIPGTSPSVASVHVVPVENRIVALQHTTAHQTKDALGKMTGIANTVKTVVDEGKAAFTALKSTATSVMEFAAAASA